MLENNASVVLVKEILYHYLDNHARGEERKRIIKENSRWFGRPVHMVAVEIRKESNELTNQEN
ncbi:MAG: hypothetical protein ACI9VI_003306 [Candidatus Azotimanducaceae bacterium]|jgi:hypothetical protein